MQTHLSLFSGIGGLDLAAEWAGFTTVGQCEWADYPMQVLERHWPEVPRWRDIKTLTKESFYERTGLAAVDIISGGFPCQPFSVAGKQRGAEDDRYLWPEMLRVISELKPAWVVGENVAGIVNMALDTVLSDLEAAGYEARTFIIPACGVDAPHRRYRAAIVGRTKTVEDPDSFRCQQSADVCQQQRRAEFERSGENLAHTNSGGLQREQRREYAEQSADRGWWAAEPGVGRVAHGIPNRVERIRCLGNAVVPQQFYPIFRAIAEIEGDQ